MLFPRRCSNMSPMSWHILQHSNTHSELLAVGKTLITLRVGVKLLLIKLRKFIRIDRNQLILLIPVPDKARTPAPVSLLKEETEAAICLCIDLCAVNGESLSDSSFHLGDSAAGIGRDIGRDTVAAVHDKSALVHSSLGGCYEVLVGDSARPGRVHVGSGVEDRLKVLPLTGIANYRYYFFKEDYSNLSTCR